MKKIVLFAFLLIPMLFFANEEFLIGDPLPDAPELAYRGNYSVGVRTLTIIDEDRLDILNYSENNPNPTYDRPLTVEVWYPCEIGPGRIEKTVYVDEQFVDDAIVFTGRALRNAKPVVEEFPLIIVSHYCSYVNSCFQSNCVFVVPISHTYYSIFICKRF